MSENDGPAILESGSVRRDDLPLVGGKAVNLARLERFGQTVPPWYAVSTTALREVLERSGLEAKIAERLQRTHDEAARTAAAGEIREWIRRVELPPELTRSVVSAHERLIPAGAFVAVRSSPQLLKLNCFGY